jgi:hypothetical protein
MEGNSNYYIDEKHAFVIEDYNRAKPFASFLPAIAGLNGKPMWVYYVNRGQCISTFGVHNKDHAIMEFQPANKAYRQTAREGFRTFLRVKSADSASSAGGTVFYEPFQSSPCSDAFDITQRMIVTSYDLKIEEINRTLRFKLEISCCTLPEESLAGLIRKVTLTNISGGPLEIEMLDGMPVIIPSYLEDADLKAMSNLRQAWMGVEHKDGLPFYRIKALPYDTSETVLNESGNFYLNVDFEGGGTNISKVIVEPAAIFGDAADLSYPASFAKGEFTFPRNQAEVGYTPCGFTYRTLTLDAGKSYEDYTLVGNAESYKKIEGFVVVRLTESYLKGKMSENRALIEGLKDPVFTVSNSEAFDLYCGQTFLDNLLRGGCPVRLGGRHAFYVYSRKHGDLEREYNFFQVDATYYSQGNANFRDVNQNRRNDVYFFPFIGDANVYAFFNFIKLDGFNPLVLTGSQFRAADLKQANRVINLYIGPKDAEMVSSFLEKPFTPGSLLGFLETKRICVTGDAGEFLDRLLAACEKEELADFHEGYWVDHWTYNTDLLEQFIDMYPDRAAGLLFERKDCFFYDSAMVVQPRNKKYVLTERGVRQYGAVAAVVEKQRLIDGRAVSSYRVRAGHGEGDVYCCTLVAKIIALLVNKIASLDPGGVGVEMDADKPGWCDALNGLPGILGSSINESAEISRLAALMLDCIERFGAGVKTIKLPAELASFYAAIKELLSGPISDFDYWELSSRKKEEYRGSVLFGVSGGEAEIDIDSLKAFLNAAVQKVKLGIGKAADRRTGVFYTYFINEVTEYEILKDGRGETVRNASGLPCVRALKFRQRPIPYFLEGPVHVLRMLKDREAAVKFHRAIKDTGLYDRKLQMYKLSDNIMEETNEIGRQNVFPRGWLENESVFLHMEYKYFLELLRCGAYEEFFECFRHALVPFLDPAVYGRSILENSSFIASSAHPDEKLHGAGFVSRLTGASAEFLTMWRFMTVGQRPFFLDDKGGLCLALKPALPGWLFTDKPKSVEINRGKSAQSAEKLDLPAGTFACRMLGRTLAVYHNGERRDTFGPGGVSPQRIEIRRGGEIFASVKGNIVPPPYAQEIREGKFDRIDIYFN